MIKSRLDTALFGGSFDPPHLGHREIIEKTLQVPGIEQVVVLPAWLNPFKKESHAPPEKRLQWCRKVFDLPGVIVSDYEIRQKRPVYTVESYHALSREYPIGWLVIGSDNLENLPKWHAFERLNRELSWIVATREGSSPDLSHLRSVQILELHVAVSSTQIRTGEGYNFVDPRIREEVHHCYQTTKKEPM